MAFVLYQQDLYIIYIFLIFSISILTLIYIRFIDTTFEKKHPIIFKILRDLCLILIIACTFILLNSYFFFKLKSIIHSLLNTKPSNSHDTGNSNGPNWTNGPGGPSNFEIPVM